MSVWKKHWYQFLILLVLAFIWGSSFILMKVGLKSYSNEQAAAIRMFLASVVLIPLSLKNLRYLKRKDLIPLLYSGFFGSFIPAFLFTKAQTRIDSALAGMLNSLTPIFTLLIGVIFLRSKYKWQQISGLILGLIGAIGLISGGESLSFEDINSYGLFVVLATVLYGSNINIVKSYLTHLTGVQITSLSFMFLSPVALAYLLWLGLEPTYQHQDWLYHFFAIAGLGIFGTAAAMLLMNSLIRYTSPIFASSVTYMIPVVAIFWGMIDGENITFHHIGNMVIILAGVYMINRTKRKTKTRI